MIRDFKEDQQLKIDVHLKPVVDGAVCSTAYLAKDVPFQPFGVDFSIVSFWVEDKLMIYPISMIDHCELYDDASEEGK